MTSTDPFSTEPLLQDHATRGAFPQPLGHALDSLVTATLDEGESTTPDELAAVIEELFTWLGRLWVAEYLHAVEAGALAADDNLNRDLLERVVASDRMLTGQWVSLARRVRAHFDGKSTVVAGLHAVDFGDLHDDAHPVARLVAFRNEFAHGNFQASVARIREHRALVHGLLERLPALRAQPVVSLDADTRTARAVTRACPVVDAPPGPALPAAHPVILGAEGARLDLYPLLHVAWRSGRPALEEPSKLHPISALRERQALALWSARYDRERAGYVEWPAGLSGQELPAAVMSDLRSALATRTGGLVLLEAHPGSHVEAAVAALTPDDPKGLGLARFAAVARVAVRPGEPTQSGFTVANVVLRLVERALGEKELTRALALKDLLGPSCPLAAALRDLDRAGRSVCLGLDGLHHGVEAYRGEARTVRQVYEALSNSRVVVVATLVPGGLERPLYDVRIPVPPPEVPAPDDVRAWTRRLLRTPLHRRVLRALVDDPAPTHLFALCDLLEQRAGPGDANPVFEPAVERALWDLRPLLTWTRQEVEVEGAVERVRMWAFFSAAARSAAQEVLS